MRKISLILAICFSVISAPTMAQNVTYACQYIRSGGLNWESNQWKPTGFTLKPPFFIAANNNSIIPSSLEKVLGADAQEIHCHLTVLDKTQTCSDYLGGVLSFSFKSLNGAIAQTFSGTSQNNAITKDQLLVATFTCTKM